MYGSGAGDLLHGIVEGETEHAHAEVDGIARKLTIRPAPIGVFDDETGIGRHGIIARVVLDHGESAFFEQRNQWCDACGTDLVVGPARFRRRGCHSLFSNGVG